MKFSITILNELNSEIASEWIKRELESLFNGYSLVTNVNYDENEEIYHVEFTGQMKEGAQRLENANIISFIKLFPFLLNDTFNIDAYVNENSINLTSDDLPTGIKLKVNTGPAEFTTMATTTEMAATLSQNSVNTDEILKNSQIFEAAFQCTNGVFYYPHLFDCSKFVQCDDFKIKKSFS